MEGKLEGEAAFDVIGISGDRADEKSRLPTTNPLGGAPVSCVDSRPAYPPTKCGLNALRCRPSYQTGDFEQYDVKHPTHSVLAVMTDESMTAGQVVVFPQCSHHHDFAVRFLHIKASCPPSRRARTDNSGVVYSLLHSLLLIFTSELFSFLPICRSNRGSAQILGFSAKSSRNVTLCPGSVRVSFPYQLARAGVVSYDLTSVETSECDLTASLVLANEGCHTYGTDHENLSRGYLRNQYAVE